MQTALLVLLLLCRPGSAQACDAKKLQKSLEEATPRSISTAWLALASCDPALATTAAETAFPRMLPAEDTPQALVRAVDLGLGPQVRTWMEGILPNERSTLFSWFGAHCTESPTLLPFLAESRALLQERFWDDRWHRALMGCQEVAALDIVRTGLQAEDVTRSTRRFTSVLEVYTTNWRGTVLPTLKALLVTTSGENQLAVLRSFPDAAGVGSLDGADPKAVAEAVATIVEVAPTLPPEVVKEARGVVTTLGDPAAASRLAGAFYRDSVREGALHWGVIGVERATCKNGKIRLGVHGASVVDPGTRWAEEVAPPAEQAAQAAWKMDLADKCGGTSTVEWHHAPNPFATDQAYQDWVDAEFQKWKLKAVDKVVVTPELPLSLATPN